MAVYQLENEELRIRVISLGAELKSVEDVRTEREYMWYGDSQYWGRTSPVLFPVVGGYRDKESRYDGAVYRLPQHGFARDMEFMMTEKKEAEIWFCLTDKEETWDGYPFAFALEIGYRLEGRKVTVMWRVSNPAKQRMYFSIGGHPGFNVPVREPGKITCYVKFEGCRRLIARQIRNGLATDGEREILLEESPFTDGAAPTAETRSMVGGLLPVTEEAFAGDALVLEHGQCRRVQLLDGDRKPFVTVSFEAPLFGVWTPPGQNAPFLCIEPWYGRCDREDFAGDISEREWGNRLEPGGMFEASYAIEV